MPAIPVEKKIANNSLQYIENRIVNTEEPMRLYDAKGKQPKPLPEQELEGSYFNMSSM